MHGDTSRLEGDDGIAAELADLLREHFGTPLPRFHGGPATDPPSRLLYLLDHEYTLRGLTWRRLKGADARRVSLLRTAAGQAGCEAVLALADVKTTHSLEETSLHADSREVCASTPTGALTPYSTEYEGYMGNWGNTLDRWYHRAAVIVWPWTMTSAAATCA